MTGGLLAASSTFSCRDAGGGIVRPSMLAGHLPDEGLASRAVARKVGCTPGTASRWRVRYAREGLDGLEDHQRPGKAPMLVLFTGLTACGYIVE